MSDEARERMLIAEQIERAKVDAGEDEDPELKSGSPLVDEGLGRKSYFILVSETHLGGVVFGLCCDIRPCR